jgi:hypothetical protein
LPIASAATAATAAATNNPRPPRRTPLPAWRSPARDGKVGGGAGQSIPSPAAAPSPSSVTKDDCDPPFTIDDRGHKHYKPACL